MAAEDFHLGMLGLQKMMGQMGTDLWVSKKGRGWRRGMGKRVGEVGTKELGGSGGFACVAAATQATRAAAANTREVGTKELGGGLAGRLAKSEQHVGLKKMIGQMGTGLWVSKKGRGWRRGMGKRAGEVGTKELGVGGKVGEVGTKELGVGEGGMRPHACAQRTTTAWSP